MSKKEINVFNQSIPSVELTKNANGKYSWKVKMYSESPDAAFKMILKINAKLEKIYGKDKVEI